MEAKNKSLLDFVFQERLLAIAVIGSIITFQFISSFKINIIDPLIEVLFPESSFNYLNITIRDGIEVPRMTDQKLVIDFGQFLKQFLAWISVIGILYVLSLYTSMPDVRKGNIHGAAIM